MAQSIPQPEQQRAPRSYWWLEPLATSVVFSLWVLFSLWEIFFHTQGRFGNYLAPYFSPDVAAWLHVDWFPALWVAWVPLLFRATCYYYRREYYRAFFWDPPACAVNERIKNYRGETSPPTSWAYLHRFFLYLSIVVVVFLWADAVAGFDFNGHFGVGIGSLVLLVDAILLSLYTFSCHAFRHLVGGDMNCMSCPNGQPRARYRVWQWVTTMNRRHGLFAWLSMFWVTGTELYVRFLILGNIHMVRFF